MVITLDWTYKFEFKKLNINSVVIFFLTNVTTKIVASARKKDLIGLILVRQGLLGRM